METRKKSIELNFIMNALLTMSSFIFPLITYPYVSRVLQPEGMGKVSLATSVISYFVMLSQLGIPTYGIRACAKVRDDRNTLSKTAQEILIINLVMCILSYVLLAACILFIPKLRDEKALYLIVSSTILFNTIGMEWLYKSLEEYRYITIRSLVFKLIALVCMFLLVHTKEDYMIYGGISILASSASGVCNIINAKKYISFAPIRPYDFKRHIKPIIIFFAMSCAITVYTNLDTVMLGFMKTDAEVGYYSAAVKAKIVLVSVITALSTVILPRASYHIERNEFGEFWKLAQKAMSFVLLSSVPLCIYFMVMSEETIMVLAGANYEAAVLPMQIILPTIIFIGITNVLGFQIMIPQGKEKLVVYSTVVGALVDLVVNYLLIPRYSVVGVTIGTLVAELAVLIVQLIFVRDNMAQIFKQISWVKILTALIPGLLIIFFLRKQIPNALVSIIITGIVFFVIYLIMLLVEKEPLIQEYYEKVRYRK